eukprot:SAG31_NODE_3893_length_3774_cov_5.674558_2_plen_743_part_00
MAFALNEPAAYLSQTEPTLVAWLKGTAGLTDIKLKDAMEIIRAATIEDVDDLRMMQEDGTLDVLAFAPPTLSRIKKALSAGDATAVDIGRAGASSRAPQGLSIYDEIEQERVADPASATSALGLILQEDGALDALAFAPPTLSRFKMALGVGETKAVDSGRADASSRAPQGLSIYDEIEQERVADPTIAPPGLYSHHAEPLQGPVDGLQHQCHSFDRIPTHEAIDTAPELGLATYTVTKGPKGFGAQLKEAGLPKGAKIVKVNGVPVFDQDGVFAQLEASGDASTVEITVAVEPTPGPFVTNIEVLPLEAQTASAASTPLLVAAARCGNAEACEELLASGHEVETVDPDNGSSSLHVAAETGHLTVCNALLVRGANTEAKTNGGGTPLHIAAFKGHKDVCVALLGAGADEEATNDVCGWTPLHFAAFSGSYDACDALLTVGIGVDVDAKSEDTGVTALQIAAARGHAKICELLLLHSANEEAIDMDACLHGRMLAWKHRTALHFAAENGHAAVCALLVKAKFAVDARTIDGETPLHFAAASGSFDTCKTLLAGSNEIDVQAKDTVHGMTALHRSAELGHVAVCKMLLSAGAIIDARTNGGDGTPLHIAAFKGHGSVCNALLAAGANKEARNLTTGWRALHYAAYGGSMDAWKEVAGAVANNKDNWMFDSMTCDGKTAMDLAKARGHKHLTGLKGRWWTLTQGDKVFGFSAILLMAIILAWIICLDYCTDPDTVNTSGSGTMY